MGHQAFSGEPTLEVYSLTKRYGSRRGVDGVSFCLRPGLYALLGPNCAGKTTLLRILATVLRPQGGRVLFRRREPQGDLYWFRERLGYLPQEFGVYPEMTAYQFLSYLGRLKAIPEGELPRRVAMAMDWTGLDVYDKRPLSRYSHGMRQLIGIAQAFLNDPELLLLDEPFTGLDPEVRLKLSERLAAFAQHGIALVSTHVAADVDSMASLLILREGRLIFFGTQGQLLDATSGLVFEAEVSSEGWDRWGALSDRLTVTSLIRDGGRCRVRFVTGTQGLRGSCSSSVSCDFRGLCGPGDEIPGLERVVPAREVSLEEAYIAYLLGFAMAPSR